MKDHYPHQYVPTTHIGRFFGKREVYHWFGRLSTRIRWKDSRKMHLFKTLNRVEIFENIGFSFNCVRPKREVFEHHILLPLCMLLKNAIVISIFLAIFFWWTGENDLNVVCADPHFLTTEKKSPFLKYIRIRVKVALVISLQVSVFLGGENKSKERKNYLNMEVQILTISLAILKKSSVVINWSRTRVLVRELKEIHVL